MNDIVEGLNKYLEQCRKPEIGHFVLHKTIESNAIVKAQKVYRAEVWYVSINNRRLVFGAQINSRGVTEAENTRNLSLLTTDFTKALLEYVNSQEFKELCKNGNE